MNELIERGLINGYLTFDEVYSYIEKNHLTESDSESLFDACADNGIELRDDSDSAGDFADDKYYESDISSPYESSLKIYMSEAKQTPILPKEEQARLLKIYRTSEGKESAQARDMLIRTNLPLVISIAKKYRGLGLPFEDLIQEGNIGLMIGLSKFDITRDVAVSTYVTFWIRQRISRAIIDTGTNIRIPVMTHAVMDRIRRFCNEFESKERRSPSIQEIADGLDLSEHKVREHMMQANMANIVSLDIPIGDEEDTSLVDMIADPVSNSPVRKAMSQSLLDTINHILDGMSERDKQIITMRFGLDGSEPMTLDQIGQVLHLTRERVRQLETKILRRMRGPKYAHLLRDFMNGE